MNKYRSHNCNELRKDDLDKNISISGWINKKRDHGNLLFIDLRDNYGITQCIIDKENKNFLDLEKTQLETVIKVSGKVVSRSDETVNKEIETGEIEVVINKFEILGTCKELPMPVFSDQEYAEEIIAKLGANSIKDMGKVMGALKQQYSDDIDFAKAGALLKQLLN